MQLMCVTSRVTLEEDVFSMKLSAVTTLNKISISEIQSHYYDLCSGRNST